MAGQGVVLGCPVERLSRSSLRSYWSLRSFNMGFRVLGVKEPKTPLGLTCRGFRV